MWDLQRCLKEAVPASVRVQHHGERSAQTGAFVWRAELTESRGAVTHSLTHSLTHSTQFGCLLASLITRGVILGGIKEAFGTFFYFSPQQLQAIKMWGVESVIVVLMGSAPLRVSCRCRVCWISLSISDAPAWEASCKLFHLAAPAQPLNIWSDAVAMGIN